MNKITEDDIYKIDEKLALQGVPFHARPFHAARLILGDDFFIPTQQNPRYKEIINIYSELIPEVNFTWPGMGTGIISSIDRIKKVTISISFGTPHISVHEGLGFSRESEWFKWCREDHKIIAKSIFAFSDMYDLVYGINDLSSVENNSLSLWGLATEHLQLVAESIYMSGSINSSVIQSICLIAELSIKGTLLYLNVPEKDLRNPKLYSHNLNNLANKMCSEKTYKDDQLLLNLISKFPNFVQERYQKTTLTRLEIISLALNAQFIAASAVRRISNRDIFTQNKGFMIGARSDYFN